MSDRMTNREFAKQDQTFKTCCSKVIVGYTEKKDGSGNTERDDDGKVIMEAILLPPTVRQASKFRAKKGAAYKVLKGGK
jgi:hypothetical protein